MCREVQEVVNTYFGPGLVDEDMRRTVMKFKNASSFASRCTSLQTRFALGLGADAGLPRLDTHERTNKQPSLFVTCAECAGRSLRGSAGG